MFYDPKNLGTSHDAPTLQRLKFLCRISSKRTNIPEAENISFDLPL